MKRSAVWLCALGLFCLGIALAGCGGGGGGGASSRKADPKARVIQTTRMSRSLLAVSGLGRTITRSATPPAARQFSMAGRISLIFTTAASAGKAITAPVTSAPALDPGTGLYYTTTLQPDGSGQQMLYVDSALTMPAGSFVWFKPQWATPQPATYPAIINVTYSITAGSYAGVAGTMRVTVNDPNFQNGLIELALTDSQHESAKAQFNLSAEGIAGAEQMQFPDGDSCSASTSTDSGVLDQVFTFPDGGSEKIDTNPDGTSTETYTNSDSTNAPPDFTGSVQADGSDTIDDNSTGDSSTVDVDPGDDSGDDSGGDSGDSTDSADIRSAHKGTRSTTKKPAVIAPRRF